LPLLEVHVYSPRCRVTRRYRSIGQTSAGSLLRRYALWVPALRYPRPVRNPTDWAIAGRQPSDAGVPVVQAVPAAMGDQVRPHWRAAMGDQSWGEALSVFWRQAR